MPLSTATESTSTRLSICFVAQSAYNVLAQRNDLQQIGGAEVQQVKLARGLASRGWRVTLIVHDHRQPDGIVVDGIQLFRSYRPEAGVWPLRFLHPRLTGLWAAMRRADADVYYQRGAESETGLVACWCRRHSRRFVFAVAGHHMLLPNSRHRVGRREELLYRYGMTHADLILVQSADQQSLLRRRFGLEARILRSCCSIVEGKDLRPGPLVDKRSGVLWVGRFDAIKRLDLCLDVAERLPRLQFVIVGKANRSSQSARNLEHRAASLPNVVLAGYIPPREVRAYYRRAAALLCTSSSEGWPNTFMEAWACGTPVVSSVDPDEVIEANQLGRVGETCGELAAALTELDPCSEEWNLCSRRCLAYVSEHHDPDRIVQRLEESLLALTVGPALRT